jgi:hypothetical protein
MNGYKVAKNMMHAGGQTDRSKRTVFFYIGVYKKEKERKENYLSACVQVLISQLWRSVVLSLLFAGVKGSVVWVYKMRLIVSSQKVDKYYSINSWIVSIYNSKRV